MCVCVCVLLCMLCVHFCVCICVCVFWCSVWSFLQVPVYIREYAYLRKDVKNLFDYNLELLVQIFKGE